MDVTDLDLPAPEEPGDAFGKTELIFPPSAPAGNQPKTVAEVTRGEPLTDATQPPTVVDPGPAEVAPATYRPVRRPPLALLCVLDDGREDGEWVRIRTPNFVIGRNEGDLLIPHDTMMSGRHASLSRTFDQNRHRWTLTDLQSTNGTYLKVASVHLKDRQELLIGSRRLRFNAAPQGVPNPAEPAPPPETRGWQTVAPEDLVPSLTEVTTQGDGQRYPLTGADNWIGREAGCAVLLAHDPLVNARHARVYRDARDRWRLDNNKSLNGTWLRVEKIALAGTVQFQLGEQRFVVKFL
jgi:pSer/pThr/pTyr-binding forkhead associated (FHA) protein